MGKKRPYTGLNLDGTAVTNPARTTDTNNSSNLLGSSSLYGDNVGGQNIGGRVKQAGFGNDYFKQRILGFDGGEVTDGYSKQGVGSFNPFSQDTDYEKIRKDNQSTGVASVNLMGQFLSKTAINTVGGVIGGFYGLGSAAANWDINKLVDNSFVRGVDAASEGVDEHMSVFTSQADKENGAFGMFSGLETLKSVSDAFAFTTGAILTELTMQTIGNVLTGGAAEAGMPGRAIRYAAGMGKLLSKEGGISRNLAKVGLGVGDKLRRVGADAELVSAFIRNADILPDGARIMQKAAMTEGMGMDALQKYNSVARGFEIAGSGTRKVLTGSMYEGSLEGRQAYDSMMQNAEITIDAQMVSEGIGKGLFGEEKELAIQQEKEKRLAVSEKTAKSMMLQVAAMNVGLLAASNAIQFPTLFGVKSFSAVKNVNANSKFFARNAEGIAEVAAVSGYKKALSKGVGALKEPATEFMEETLQGVISKERQNYHERLTQTKSHTGGMEHPIAEFSETFIEAFKKQYGEKEGLEEGLIGAIVGALGAPSFKKNSKGKIRPTMVGGLKGHFEGQSEYEKNAIKEALEVLNSGSQLSSLRYNLDQSKMNSFSANEKNLAQKNDDKGSFESAGTDDIFQHVAGYFDKGLKDKYLEEKEMLKQMSPEEYTMKTRGEEAEAISAEEKEKELKDYFGKADAYAESYEKAFKNMKMDKMDDSPLNKKLLSHIAYAMAKDKTELAKYDEQSKLLFEKGLKMTPRELYRLAKMHNQFGNFTKKEMEAEIASLTNDFSRIHFEDYRDGQGSIDDDFAGEKISAAARKKAKSFLGKLQGAEDVSTARAELARIERMGSEGVKVPLATMRARELAMRSEVYKNAKEQLDENKAQEFATALAEKSQKDNTKQNMRSNISAAKKFQSQQSQVMRQLAGKQERILGVDMDQYLKDMEMYKEQLAATDDVPTAFMDALDSKGTADINVLLEELSDTVARRENSLRIAANLYGLTGVNKALAGIARAELIAAYNNNQLYRNALAHFIKRGGLDDSGAEEAIAYKKLEISLAALKEAREDYNKMIHEEEDNSEIQAIVDFLDREIKISEALLDDYVDIIESEEAKERANDIALGRTNGKSTTEVVEKIKKEIITHSEEEIAEAEALEKLKKEHGDLVGSSKTTLDLYASEGNTQRDGNLAELIDKGSVKRGDIVYIKPSMDLKIGAEMQAAMSIAQIELYEKGLELFRADSTRIADAEAMDPQQFMKDGVLMLEDFPDNEDAALQFFVMTFPVNKEITNDYLFKSASGSMKPAQKEGDERISRESFLYSPYDSFAKNKESAISKAQILKKDADTVARMTAEMSKLAEDSIDYLELKAKKSLLEISVVARTLKANDATLYELRKQVLVGMTLHKASSEKDNPYVMQTLVSDFSYGKVNEHTVDGEFQGGNYNTFPMFPSGADNPAFDTDGNFLSDEVNAEAFFNSDKLYLALQPDKEGRVKLVSVKTGAEFKFSTHQAETGEDVVDSETEGASKETVERKYQTGRLYYMNETATGVSVPVKLNMNELKSVPAVIDGLKKYLNIAVKEITAEAASPTDEFKLYAQPITLEDGDFGGLFDNMKDGRPQTIHDLFSFFAPKMNDAYEITEGKMIREIGEKGEVLKETGEKSGVSSLLDNMDIEEDDSAKTSSTSKKKKSTTAPAKTHFKFNTGDKTMEEMDEAAVDEIIESVGNMRFYFNKNLSVSSAKGTNGGALTNPSLFSFTFTSGLVSHGFEVNQNREKVYAMNTEQTVMEDGKFSTQSVPKQASMSIRPREEGILVKSRQILNKAYPKESAAENFPTALKRMFKKNGKEDKYKLSFSIMARQTLYMATKRFQKSLKEEQLKGEVSEIKRKALFDQSIKAELAVLRYELKIWEDKSAENKSRMTVIGHVNQVLTEFETFYNTKSNGGLFQAMYTKKAKSEHYDDLNNLLFNSSEINNDLAPLMPIVSKNKEGVLVGTSSVVIDEAYVGKFIDAVFSHIETSKKHSGMSAFGEKGGLPIDISISTLSKDAKGNHKNVAKRVSPVLSKDGKITSSGTKGSKVYINEQTPLKYMNEKGEFIDLTPSSMSRLTFEKKIVDGKEVKGKLLKGRIFMIVGGLAEGKFINVMNGTEDIIDVGNKSYTYATGVNFPGHKKDLTQDSAEMNSINATIEGATTASGYETTVINSIGKKMARKEQSWEDAYDEAMEAKDAFDEAKAQGALSTLLGTGTKKKKFSALGNMEAEDEETEEQKEINRIRDAEAKAADLTWLFGEEGHIGQVNEMIKGMESPFSLRKYSEMTDAQLMDVVSNFNEGEGKTAVLNAIETEPEKLRAALDGLAFKRRKRLGLQESQVMTLKDLADEELKKKKPGTAKKEKVKKAAVTFKPISVEDMKDIRSDLERGADDVTSEIYKELKNTYKDSTDSDIFVLMLPSITGDNVAVAFSNDAKALGAIIFKEDYDESKVKKLVDDYNETCEMPF